ncbi:unnamed protein product [Phyllotreta striolata]|uniref:Cytosolic non-specific dipeptidase n=1 Tax=Phyllotreta striolata TaxID=444603 RepID=A0A9N9TT91_PHYSR|nr:unnamed protein product [Phyllotreta striolata]
MVYPHAYRMEHTETNTSNNMYGLHAISQSKKIKIPPELLKLLQTIDSMKEKFMQNLAKAIEIKSVGPNLLFRNDVQKMVMFVEEWLKVLGMKHEVFNIGTYTVEGKKCRLPPVILASLGNDPNKRTICAYVHVDVPDPKFQKWDTDPWKLTVKDGKLYGNGTGCGKGPLMCWLHALLTFKMNKMPLPVNFRMCIEMMGHANSQGFGAFCSTKKQDFFNHVDFVVQIDGEWIGHKVPCIIFGTVGNIHMEMTMEGDSIETMKSDMNTIFDSMVNERMEIQIPHYSDSVEQIGPDEEMIYAKIDEFDPEEIRESLPPHKRSWDRVRLLINMWRLPSVMLDKIEECTCPNREKKMIRRHFILKIVPRQTLDYVKELVVKHVQRITKEKNLKNKANLKIISAGKPWVENINSSCYSTAKKAILQITKMEPFLIREQVSRETTNVFDSGLEKKLVILPICARGSNLGQANEHISSRCYQEAIKVLVAYMFQVASLKTKKNVKAKSDKPKK